MRVDATAKPDERVCVCDAPPNYDIYAGDYSNGDGSEGIIRASTSSD